MLGTWDGDGERHSTFVRLTGFLAGWRDDWLVNEVLSAALRLARSLACVLRIRALSSGVGGWQLQLEDQEQLSMSVQVEAELRATSHSRSIHSIHGIFFSHLLISMSPPCSKAITAINTDASIPIVISSIAYRNSHIYNASQRAHQQRHKTKQVLRDPPNPAQPSRPPNLTQPNPARQPF